ncbi:MAG: HEPN domain-containing protein [Acidobacteria bacterium]|nr:HEPN domain-containing protein [Acidobacteriota bacterium]
MGEQMMVPDASLRFLATAQQDLEAARCLFNHQFFPQAVYYLEQSIEKAFKSYAFFTNVIDERQARSKIGHKGLKIAEKSIDNLQENVRKIESSLGQDPDTYRYFTRYFQMPTSMELEPSKKQIRVFQNEGKTELSTSSKRLKNYLKGLERLEAEYNSGLKELKDGIYLSDLEFNQIKRRLLKFIEIVSSRDSDEAKHREEEFQERFTKELFEGAIRRALPYLLKTGYLGGFLFYLMRLLQPHAFARYPQGEFHPVEFYNQDLPLIQNFEECVDFTIKALQLLEDLYQEFKSEVNCVT